MLHCSHMCRRVISSLKKDEPNIIQIHNNVMWDSQYSPTEGGMYLGIFHDTLLWIWIMY